MAVGRALVQVHLQTEDDRCRDQRRPQVERHCRDQSRRCRRLHLLADLLPRPEVAARLLRRHQHLLRKGRPQVSSRLL